MLQHDHSCTKLSVSVSVINVGLLIGPLSVKSKDPGFLGKDSLFYWKKIRTFLRLGSDPTFSGSVFAAPASAYRSKNEPQLSLTLLTDVLVKPVE